MQEPGAYRGKDFWVLPPGGRSAAKNGQRSAEKLLVAIATLAGGLLLRRRRRRRRSLAWQRQLPQPSQRTFREPYEYDRLEWDLDTLGVGRPCKVLHWLR